MTWLDAATRWRTWVDRDEPGRVAAYLDSLEEDEYLDLHNAINVNTLPELIDSLFWSFEKNAFLKGDILTWSTAQITALHTNIRYRLLRMYKECYAVSSMFSIIGGATGGPLGKLKWSLRFDIGEKVLVRLRQPGAAWPPPLGAYPALSQELRTLTGSYRGGATVRTAMRRKPTFPACQYILADYDVPIETPPRSQLGSWARDLLQSHPQ